MTKVVTARAGADGVLSLTVPLGQIGASKLVRVTVETVEEAATPAPPPNDRENWLRFLEQTAGSITDPTFERPPQERDD